MNILGKKPEGIAPAEEIVEQLARLLVAHEEGVPFAYVRELIDEGAPLGSIYRDLLAPTARLLGEMWCEAMPGRRRRDSSRPGYRSPSC